MPARSRGNPPTAHVRIDTTAEFVVVLIFGAVRVGVRGFCPTDLRKRFLGMLITRAPQSFGPQSVRPRHLGLAVAVTLTLLSTAIVPARDPIASSKPPQRQKTKIVATPEDVAQWVADLKDDDYEIRERAQRRLQKVGKAAIRPLIEGVQSADPEVSWRCGEILQQLSLRGDDATIGALTEAAVTAAASSQHTGLQAFVTDLTNRQKERRHNIVKLRLQSVGAQVDDGQGYDTFDLDADDGPVLIPGEAIEVDEEWIEPAEAGPEEAVPSAPDEEAAPKEPPGVDPANDATTEPAVEEPGAEEPAIPESAIEEEPPSEPELASPAVPEDPDGEDIEVAAEPDLEDLGLGRMLKEFGGLEKGGLEKEEAEPLETKRILKAPKDPEVVVVRGFLGGFGGVPGLVAIDGQFSGRLILDAAFSGKDHDLKDAKDLLGISMVVLASPKLSDETLKHVAEMPELARLTVNGGAFTSAGLREFRKARPEVVFFASGPAVLGIKGITSGPCRVDEIVPNAGAAVAGLASGDEIISVDGQAIESFADLTVEVYNHKPGEKIKIVYLRNGKRNEATVLLGQRLPGQ